MKFEEYRFQNSDGIDRDRYLIGTYLLSAPKKTDILNLVKSLAEEQTTGTWVKDLPEETEELKKKYAGKIVGVYEVPDFEVSIPEEVENRKYIAKIAFPVENFKGQIPLMISTVFGNVSSLGEIRLLDLDLPKKYLEDFDGPNFGIDGLREFLNIPDRPLVCNMTKPDTGFTAEVGANMFYEAAKGGCDIVKDDELLGDPEYCKMEDRITQYMEKADQVEEETGEKTLYTPNITDRADKVFENAEKALDLGVNGLMLNVYTSGLSTLRALSEDPSIDVPILGHLDFSGAIYESPKYGVSSPLILGKLQRLAGADMAIFPAAYGKFPMIKKKYFQIYQSYTNDWKHVDKTLPGPAAGVHPGMVPQLMEDLGTDQMISAGGAVHGHPQGSVKGGKALRQAIEASMKNKPIDEYAEDHEELKKAIEEWGIVDSDTDMYKEDFLGLENE